MPRLIRPAFIPPITMDLLVAKACVRPFRLWEMPNCPFGRSAPWLSIDMGFNVEGYNTDRTQVYWSGAADTIPGPIRRAHAVCVEILNKPQPR